MNPEIIVEMDIVATEFKGFVDLITVVTIMIKRGKLLRQRDLLHGSPIVPTLFNV